MGGDARERRRLALPSRAEKEGGVICGEICARCSLWWAVGERLVMPTLADAARWLAATARAALRCLAVTAAPFTHTSHKQP